MFDLTVNRTLIVAMTRRNALSETELIKPTDMNHKGSLLLYRKENYTGRRVIATTTGTVFFLNVTSQQPE